MEDIYAYLSKLIYERREYMTKISHLPNAANCYAPMASAYDSCLSMLQLARNGDWEKLKQFDYFREN